MGWFITIIVLLGAAYLYRHFTTDAELNRVGAVTRRLERLGAQLHGINEHRFNAIVKVTTYLRIGIHALKNDQPMLLDDEVIEVFEEFIGDGTVFLSLGFSNVEALRNTFAFRVCYDRLKEMRAHLTPYEGASETRSAFEPQPEGTIQLSDLIPPGAIIAETRPDDCPACGSGRVVDILYGLPADQSFREAADGKIVLGGCLRHGFAPKWQCVDCGTPIYCSQDDEEYEDEDGYDDAR